ncbi:hypothetical protein [Streptomyces sporangiiformans]|uniref:Lipoprotein n=1 Tax=Streptomyces sporangiiformans TaxID=2315329 RepID=A0A505DLA9_9ACTN|nr:hypothetical protein [Streptomyces sporangiiformans]TPQ19241.1 hypothetical protein FGD71_026575 [Streptomyces sporangiiformans]
MRIRATVAAVTGALALSALAVPAAQADDSTASRADVAKVREAARSAGATYDQPSARVVVEDDAPYALDLAFSDVKVNGGKPIVAGTSKQVTVPTTFTVTHGADVDILADDFILDVAIYRGSYGEPDNTLYGDDLPACTPVSTTVATCKGTIDVYPGIGLDNTDATSWKALGHAIAFNGQDPAGETFDVTKVGYAEQDALASTRLQRYSKLTVNAAPEPVKKGRTITVTGALTRANWNTHKYAGYTSQPVKLQYKKKGTTTYTDVKTVTSSSTGSLKTTVTASYDGYYRYNFAGTSTTPAVKATGDFVDVQ